VVVLGIRVALLVVAVLVLVAALVLELTAVMRLPIRVAAAVLESLVAVRVAVTAHPVLSSSVTQFEGQTHGSLLSNRRTQHRYPNYRGG